MLRYFGKVFGKETVTVLTASVLQQHTALSSAVFMDIEQRSFGNGLNDSPKYRVLHSPPTSSTIGGGRGCNIFVPVLRGKGTKIAPTGDRFD